MKYIPVKIVHYTELKRGDLVSYFLPLVASGKDWDFIAQCCTNNTVLKFIGIDGDVISYDVVFSTHKYITGLFETRFDKDRHNLVLMSPYIDGTPTGQRAEKENNEPTKTITHQTLTNN